MGFWDQLHIQISNCKNYQRNQPTSNMAVTEEKQGFDDNLESVSSADNQEIHNTSCPKNRSNSRSCCPSFATKPSRSKAEIEPLHCWITLFAAFWVNVNVAGLETAFPLFYDPLLDKYNSTRANVGTSASLLISFGSISALICSPFMNMYGCRPVAFLGCTLEFIGLLLSAFAPNLITFHLSFGVVGGIGLGLLYIPSLAIVQQTFSHNRGLATGLALLGFTMGTILTPLLFEFLLRRYGLFGSLLLQCAVHSHNFVFVWAFTSPKRYREMAMEIEVEDVKKTLKPESGDQVQFQHTDSEEHEIEQSRPKSAMSSFCSRLIDFSICRDVKYMLYVFVRLLWFLCRFCLSMHIVSAATHIGVKLKDASYLPAMMGFSNLVLRVVSTVVLNFKKLDKEIYFSVGIVSITVACFLAAYAEGYNLLFASMLLVGVNEGMSTTASQLVIVNLIGVDRFPKAIAIVEVATVPASMAAGPFSGWLVDVSGGYFITFLFAGGAGITATILIAVIIIMLHPEKVRTRSQEQCAIQDMKEMQPLDSKAPSELKLDDKTLSIA